MTSEDRTKASEFVGVITASQATLDLVKRLTSRYQRVLPKLDDYTAIQFTTDGTKVLDDIREEFKREFNSKQVRRSSTLLTYS